MRRRRWRIAAGLLLLLAVITVLILRTERASAWACDELRERLPGMTGARVDFGSCHVDVLQAALKLEKLAVEAGDHGSIKVSADEALVSLRGLFFGGVALHEVRVLRPVVSVAPQGEGGGMPGCPLDALKRLRVETLSVEDGSAELSLGEGQWLRLRALTANASVTKTGADLEGSIRSAQVEWSGQAPFAVGTTVFEVHLDAATRKLELSRATSSIEGASLSISGAIEKLCDAPVIDARVEAYVPMQLLAQRGLVTRASGQVAVRTQLSGRLSNPAIRADVTASQVTVNEFTPGDLTAHLSLVDRRVHLEELLVPVASGQVKVSGDIGLSESLPVSLKVETRDAPFGQVMARAGISGSWVDFPATLKGLLTGHLLPTPALSGPVDFRTGAFVLASRAFDSPKSQGRTILEFGQSQGSFSLNVGDDAVTFDDVVVRVGRESRTRVAGVVKLFFDSRRGLDVRVSSEAVDLSDFGHIAGLPWQGVGSTTVTVLGSGSDLLVDGRLALRDFKFAGYTLGVVQGPIHYAQDTLSFPSVVAQKGQTQYFGDIALVFEDAGLYTRGTVQLPAGRVEDVIDILADLSPSIQTVQGPMTGRIEALAAIDCPASALAGVIVMQVREGAYYSRRLGSASGVLRFERGEAMTLDPMTFEGPLGRFTIDGTWQFAGPLDYRMTLEDGSLAELFDPAGVKRWPLKGQASAKFKIFGTTDLVLSTGELKAEAMSWSGADLGASSLALSLKGRELDINGAVLRGVTVTSHTLAKDLWPFTAEFKVSSLDLKPFLPAAAVDVTASTSGSVIVSGPMLDFDALKADVTLSDVRIARGDISLSNVEPVSLAYDSGAVVVRSLALKGPTTQLNAEGRWGPKTADLRTSGSLDLKLIESFLPQLDRPSGHIDFTAALSGEVARPQIAGSADARDIRAGMKGYDLQLKSGSAHLDFSESRVLLQELQGFLNDGRIRGRGDMRLEGLSLQRAEVQIDLENVTTAIQEDVPATFSGSLLLAYRNAMSQLSGGVEVEKLNYGRQLALDTLLTNARSGLATSDEKPVEWLRFDVDIGLGNDVRIDNNLARARLLGKVKLAGTNVKPVLIGAIEAGEASQFFFRNNTYAVSRATLQFNGLWPTFDVSAQTQVREYLVNVKAFGKLEDPKISLSSEPALSETDILSLLTLGVTSRERFASQSGAGLAAEALLSASGLDKQMQRFLQNNVGLKDQQVRLTTTFNEATGTAEPSVSWESKVVSDNFKVGVTQPVTGRGTKAQAEYRFNQGVSARLQWDNLNQNSTVGNPGADLRFRFEWE